MATERKDVLPSVICQSENEIDQSENEINDLAYNFYSRYRKIAFCPLYKQR